MSSRATAIAVGLLAFFCFAWLAPQSSHNPQIVTRLALTLSIVERGALDIDPHEAWTIDKALFGGHYYADKAPGLSLLAVPAVALAHLAFEAAGLPAQGTDPVAFARYNWIATIASNGVLSALAVALLYLTAMRLGASRQGALFGSFALALATPFFGWSTAFFAHSASASLLVVVCWLLAVAYAGAPSFLSARPGWVGILLGGVAGATFCVDFTTAPVLAFAALLAILLEGRRARGSRLLLAISLACGGAVGLLPLFAYNQLAFGSPFILGYSNVVGFEAMKSGFFGIGWPDPAVLWELLFGAYRGLLPLSPVLALAPIGLAGMLRRPETRPAGALALFATASFLWINAGYHYWHGGYSTGPRHLVPMLPFLALALCFCWPRSPWLRAGALVLLLASLVLSVVCASVDMMAPERVLYPLPDHLLPRFLYGWALVKSAVLLPVWGAFAFLMVRAGRQDMPRRTPDMVS